MYIKMQSGLINLMYGYSLVDNTQLIGLFISHVAPIQGLATN